MTLLVALIIGILVGFVIGRLFYDGNDYLIINTIFAVAGSIFGLVLYALASGLSDESLINIGQIVGSLLGALLFMALYNFVHRNTKRRVTKQNVPGDESD